jgi:hypothetical protein
MAQELGHELRIVQGFAHHRPRHHTHDQGAGQVRGIAVLKPGHVAPDGFGSGDVLQFCAKAGQVQRSHVPVFRLGAEQRIGGGERHVVVRGQQQGAVQHRESGLPAPRSRSVRARQLIFELPERSLAHGALNELHVGLAAAAGRGAKLVQRGLWNEQLYEASLVGKDVGIAQHDVGIKHDRSHLSLHYH